MKAAKAITIVTLGLTVAAALGLIAVMAAVPAPPTDPCERPYVAVPGEPCADGLELLITPSGFACGCEPVNAEADQGYQSAPRLYH